MSFELQKMPRAGEILPQEVSNAANAVLAYLHKHTTFTGDYTIDKNIAVFTSTDLYTDPVEFARLIYTLEGLDGVDTKSVEIVHSLDKNALAIAPKGTHIKVEEVI